MVLKMMWMFINLLILSALGVRSQRISLDDTHLVTTCTQGLRGGMDLIRFTGTADATGLDVNNWKNVKFTVLSEGETDFQPVCTVDLTTCNSTSTAHCFCVVKSAVEYEVIVQETATQLYSNAKVKLVWSSDDGANSAESNEDSIPTVYDQNTEVLTLSVNGHSVDPLSKPCTIDLTEGPNTLIYCCTQSPSPCLTNITGSGQTPASAGSCSQVTINGQSQRMYLTFSHSVCRVNSFRVNTCGASSASSPTSPPKTSTSATTTSSTTKRTIAAETVSGSDSSEDTVKIVVPIVIGLVAIAVIAVLLIIKYRQKKRKTEAEDGPGKSYKALEEGQDTDRDSGFGESIQPSNQGHPDRSLPKRKIVTPPPSESQNSNFKTPKTSNRQSHEEKQTEAFTNAQQIIANPVDSHVKGGSSEKKHNSKDVNMKNTVQGEGVNDVHPRHHTAVGGPGSESKTMANPPGLTHRGNQNQSPSDIQENTANEVENRYSEENSSSPDVGGNKGNNQGMVSQRSNSRISAGGSQQRKSSFGKLQNNGVQGSSMRSQAEDMILKNQNHSTDFNREYNIPGTVCENNTSTNGAKQTERSEGKHQSSGIYQDNSSVETGDSHDYNKVENSDHPPLDETDDSLGHPCQSNAQSSGMQHPNSTMLVPVAQSRDMQYPDSTTLDPVSDVENRSHPHANYV